MQDINKRLDRIEERLFFIEQKFGLTEKAPQKSQPAASAGPAKNPEQKVADVEKRLAQPVPQNPVIHQREPLSATKVLGWCAGITFLLAMSYFLKLVYDTGWLTPERQIGLAYVAAFSLVFIGLYLEQHDHQYASYLPAVGLVVFYLTTFTGNLYYGLITQPVATVLVGVTTLLGIWLGRKFDNSVYIIFSAVGVYISPFLIHTPHPALINLVIYYSAWSLLFSFSAIQEARRINYLLPMYLAILGFDMLWRTSGKGDWQMACGYQLIQFLIFSCTTVAFSITHQKPLRSDNTLAHGLALFIFYGIEYALLKEHVPELVNYIAVLSAVVVYLVYVVAEKLYEGDESLHEGATLVSYYCSWVALHAIYFGIIPDQWLPWAILMLPVVFFLLWPRLGKKRGVLFPVAATTLILFVFGYGHLLRDVAVKAATITPMPTLALFIYVLMLYGMYYHFTRPANKRSEAVLTLYAGHLAFMACLVNIIDHDIYLSAIWACYAVALLVIAMQIKDKELGQSALLIFAASGVKVLLFDLSDTNSLVRVLTLLVLSVSLYAGGWLYQSLLRGINKDK